VTGTPPRTERTERQATNHDLHVHTTHSDGGHSVELQALLARAMRLDAVAFTDHCAPGFGLHDSDEAFDAYVADVSRVRGRHGGVIFLAGAEATALDAAGRVSIGEERARRLQWVLCDLGGSSEGTLRNTPSDARRYAENVIRTYMALCDVPYLHVIAHPFNTGNTEPCLLPADYPRQGLVELASKMAETGKVFDVMNLMVYWFQRAGAGPEEVTAQYTGLVELFASRGVIFQVSSDDHRCGIGHTTWSRRVLADAGVPARQIVSPGRIIRRR
jgi:histidinol phosphatase-like PHP family hydrolase